MRKKPASEPPLLDPKVVARLSSKKQAERQAAEQKLQALGPAARDALQQIVANEAKKFRNERRARNFGLGLMAVIFASMLVMVVIKKLGIVHFHMDSSFTTIFSSLGGMCGAAAVTKTHKNALSKLAEFEDVSNVGAFADVLDMGDRNSRVVAETALLNLVPKMRASDWQQLSDQQRGNLHHALERRKPALNEELAVRILRALQQNGDEKDLPVVQRLSKKEARTPTQKRIREEALNCLPFLQQNIEAARSSQQLLRASSAYSTPPETLLRPADSSTVSDPAQLLRPTVATVETEAPLPAMKTETVVQNEPLQQISSPSP